MSKITSIHIENFKRISAADVAPAQDIRSGAECAIIMHDGRVSEVRP